MAGMVREMGLDELMSKVASAAATRASGGGQFSASTHF
jgi:hypothetical protein